MSGQNVQYELVELPEQREYLLELLAWHNLLGIVMPMLPSSVLSDHQNRYCDRILNRQIRKVEALTGRWKQLADFLDALEVEYIPVKGISHLNRLYESNEFRNMGDIDLIVRTTEVPLIVREMHRKWRGVPNCYFSAATRFRWHRELAPIEEFSVDSIVLGRTPVHFLDYSVDLHWSPLYGDAQGRVRLDNAKLFEASEEWPQMGVRARALNPGSEMAFCILHAATSDLKILLHVVDIIRHWKRYGIDPRDSVKAWYDPQMVPGVAQVLELVELLSDPETNVEMLARHPFMAPYFGSREHYWRVATIDYKEKAPSPLLLHYSRVCAQRNWRGRLFYTLGLLLPSSEFYPHRSLFVRAIKFYTQWLHSGVAAIKRFFSS